MVDLSYTKQKDPKVAVEVLVGHGACHIINETSCHLTKLEVSTTVSNIMNDSVVPVKVDYKEVPQDPELAKNQADSIKCGDNGVFKGLPMTKAMQDILYIARYFGNHYQSDGKYILINEAKNKNKLIICQSRADTAEILKDFPGAIVNPLGDWTGGTNVDCGATNRKLGSDMYDAVTGGGLHGKDLSKADVSANIYCHVMATHFDKEVNAYCAIGDDTLKVSVADGPIYEVPYSVVIEVAKRYLDTIGGFERLAEWGFTL